MTCRSRVYYGDGEMLRVRPLYKRPTRPCVGNNGIHVKNNIVAQFVVTMESNSCPMLALLQEKHTSVL